MSYINIDIWKTQIVKICESLGKQKLFSGGIIRKKHKHIYIYISYYLNI